MGVITTFYSYKGGVGRTMALANIAVLLSKKGKKVLVVDWDLEAPGLHEYFNSNEYDKKAPRIKGGLMALLDAANINNSKPRWRDYISKVKLSDKSNLDVLWSGCIKTIDYTKHVLDFDWNQFYSKYDGGRFIEDLRNNWKEKYDHIFIDSRTGITDYGGICTIQLPDFLTLVFTPNDQSINGVKQVALNAQKARQKLAYDRMPLLMFPLLSRFDGKEEKVRGEVWLKKISETMDVFYDDWVHKDFPKLKVLENTKLPYAPYFSFGEELAVEKTSLTDTDTLGYAYNRIAKLFENDFRNILGLLGLKSASDQVKEQIYEYYTKEEYVKAEKLAREAIEIHGGKEMVSLYAKILFTLTSDYGEDGKFNKATEYYNRLERLCQSYKDDKGISQELANTAGNLGIAYQKRGDLNKAEEIHKKSLEINEKLGQSEGIANQYGNLGNVYQTRGDLNKAEEMYRKVLEIEKKIGRQESMANAYSNLGGIYQIRGDLDKAEDMLRKSLAIDEKLGRLIGMASGYGNLGLVYKTRGDLDKGEEMLKKSLEIDEKLGRLEGVAIHYGNLGTVYQERDELDKAEEMYKKSLEIDEKLGRLEGMAIQYGNLGGVYQMRGEVDKARQFWEKSRDIFMKMGIEHNAAKVQGLIDGLCD